MLTKAVRAVFIAGEYPGTMRRLYSMSPDEAIPEFYNDATVFESLHDDMPDLQVPEWAANGQEFVQRHRCDAPLAALQLSMAVVCFRALGSRRCEDAGRRWRVTVSAHRSTSGSTSPSAISLPATPP